MRKPTLIKKKLVVSLILVSFAILPFFTYQPYTGAQYQALNWVKHNTPLNSEILTSSGLVSIAGGVSTRPASNFCGDLFNTYYPEKVRVDFFYNYYFKSNTLYFFIDTNQYFEFEMLNLEEQAVSSCFINAFDYKFDLLFSCIQ